MLLRGIVIKFSCFLFAFLFSISLQAKQLTPDLAHPFFLLGPGEFTVQTRAGYFLEEFEFEKAKVVQDKFEYKHNFYAIGSVIGLPGQRQFSVDFSFEDQGKADKIYAPATNLPQQKYSYKGFHAVEVVYQEHFNVADEDDKLAFEIRFKGSPLKGKESNNTYQGKDIAFALLYSHLHNNEWRIYGDIHSEVIGRKKVRKFNNEMETTDAYSEFGTLVGVQWLHNKYWFDINGLFYLTTDYNSRSPSYDRLSDKGFIVGGKLSGGYYITPTVTVVIDHVRQGSNFNIVTESTTDATEFEIETQYTQLGLTWLF